MYDDVTYRQQELFEQIGTNLDHFHPTKFISKKGEERWEDLIVIISKLFENSAVIVANNFVRTGTDGPRKINQKGKKTIVCTCGEMMK